MCAAKQQGNSCQEQGGWLKVLLIDPNLSGMISQNVGLAYVISAAEKQHPVRLLDLTFKRQRYAQYVLEQIAMEKPQLIGLSVTSFSLQASLEISALIKTKYPSIRVIWGGGYPTLFPEESINYPAVDAICIGEGEIALNEYLHSLENGQDPVVLGIWAKDRQGRIQRNPLRPFNQCLDDLPFPNWEHWQIGEHLQRNLYFIPGAIKFLASRGCPYSCTFCSNEAIRQAIPGNYYRQRTPQSVIQEIQVNACKYGGRGFKIIHFADEIFGLHYDFLEDFCRLFKQENLDKQFKWCCATRPDILTPLWAKTAASAGCIWVWLGIESGDEYIRNHVYQKNISQEQITQAAVYLRNQGIAFSFSMMAGCPQDTQASILKGVQLINRLDPEAFDYSFYQPLPKTRLGSVAAQAMPREDFTASWQPDTPRLCTQTLSRADLKQIMWRIRLVKLRRFLRAGFKAKRFIFFLDIMKYLFSIKGCRVIPLSSPSLAMDLQLKTIFKYTAEAQAKLYKNN